MTRGVQFEQTFGTDGDAIAAGGALRFIDDGQPVRIHFDGVEVADAHAIGKSETAPGAAFASAGDKRRSATTIEAGVTRAMLSDMSSTGAGEARDLFLFVAGIDLEKLSDGGNTSGRVDVALAGRYLTLHALFGEHATARESAAAAIRAGEQRDNLINTRIFPDVQLLVGKREQRREQDAHSAHHC